MKTGTVLVIGAGVAVAAYLLGKGSTQAKVSAWPGTSLNKWPGTSMSAWPGTTALWPPRQARRSRVSQYTGTSYQNPIPSGSDVYDRQYTGLGYKTSIPSITAEYRGYSYSWEKADKYSPSGYGSWQENVINRRAPVSLI